MELVHFEAPDKQGAIIQQGWLQDALYKGSVIIQEELQEAKDCNCAGKADWLTIQLGFLNSFMCAICDSQLFLVEGKLAKTDTKQASFIAPAGKNVKNFIKEG